jgi:hypothetical protein
MATIVTRSGKGSPLTHAEVDANFENLNSGKAEVSSLATVATSGAYADLSGTPTLATVATTGAYSDLSGLPTLGTAAAADTTDFVEQTSTTGAAVLPAGTDAQRDGSPLAGYIRFNTDDDTFEGYDGTAWGAIGGAGGGLFKGENGEVGSSAGDIFRINEQTLNTSVTIDADENASATGPLTIASGVTLTVTSGGSLAIL